MSISTTSCDVSVVIATWNGARFLAASIESVLNQTCAPRELIVVDDGSTDDTAELLARYPQIRCLRREHVGQPAALNAGIALACGALLAFNDSDDVWVSNKLERQLLALQQSPETDAVFGHCEQFLEDDAPAGVRAGLTAARRIMPAKLPAAMLIKRTAFERIGLFDETLPIGAVVDWYARADAAGLHAVMLPEVVYRRRLHSANLGLRQRDAAAAGYLRMARQAMQRRRTEGGGDATA